MQCQNCYKADAQTSIPQANEHVCTQCAIEFWQQCIQTAKEVRHAEVRILSASVRPRRSYKQKAATVLL